MPNLYELALEFRAAADTLANLDLDEQALADTLESLGAELEVKAINTAMVVLNLETTVEAIKQAEHRMQVRRKSLESRCERIRSHLLASMQTARVESIKSPYFQLAVRDNPEAVEVFDPAQVPNEYLRQPAPPPPAPDKHAIRDAIKAGNEVPGCRITQGKRISIKQ